MPIYPPVTVEGRSCYQTVDPKVYIEAPILNEGLATQEIVYVNFTEQLRWKQIGLCNSCGLADKGSDIEQRLIITPGKQMGEAFSVTDPEYATRLDIPNSPSYDGSSRTMAAQLGISPYPCGFSFEWLPWI